MFPMNAWYIAGWDHQVGRHLLQRQICGKKLVLFRKQDGTAVALEDACWHRLLPLSAGSLKGDNVACAYHGLQFNGAGRCVHMPSQETLNPSACVHSYPVIERHRFVWVWMGDAQFADESKIPNLFQNDHPDWAGDGGTTHLACDYRLLIDNLMDLTHETFVHSSSIGNAAVAEAPFRVSQDEEKVTVTRWMQDIEPPPFFRKQLSKPGNVDRWQIVSFQAPSYVTIDVGVSPTGTGAREGDRSQGVTGFVIHLATPETERSCNYYWAFLRNYELRSQRLTTDWRESARTIFGEDKHILELQQQALDDYPDRDFYPLNIDGGALLARRRIQQMVEAEKAVRAVATAHAEPVFSR